MCAHGHAGTQAEQNTCYTNHQNTMHIPNSPQIYTAQLPPAQQHNPPTPSTHQKAQISKQLNHILHSTTTPLRYIAAKIFQLIFFSKYFQITGINGTKLFKNKYSNRKKIFDEKCLFLFIFQYLLSSYCVQNIVCDVGLCK